MNANLCKGEAIAARSGRELSWFLHVLGRVTLGTAGAAFFLASCTVSPRYRPAPPEPEPAASEAPTAATPVESDAELSDVAAYARSFIGTPYRTGGASRKGMDCSGLVITVYKHFDIHLPRRSIDQSHVGRTVARDAVEPGDLVFFKTSNRNPVTHVGIYVGHGRFVHASTSAHKVREDALDEDYFRHRFVVAKRVLEEP
jgi:cell wall-associated NlpC family hydrolase